jgi:hypothetical protein
MTPTLAKAVVVSIMVAWYIIRFRYARRSRRTPIARSALGSASFSRSPPSSRFD